MPRRRRRASRRGEPRWTYDGRWPSVRRRPCPATELLAVPLKIAGRMVRGALTGLIINESFIAATKSRNRTRRRRGSAGLPPPLCGGRVQISLTENDLIIRVSVPFSRRLSGDGASKCVRGEGLGNPAMRRNTGKGDWSAMQPTWVPALGKNSLLANGPAEFPRGANNSPDDSCADGSSNNSDECH